MARHARRRASTNARSRARRAAGSRLTAATTSARPTTKGPSGWYSTACRNMPRTVQLTLRERPQPGHGAPVANRFKHSGMPIPCAGCSIEPSRIVHAATVEKQPNTVWNGVARCVKNVMNDGSDFRPGGEDTQALCHDTDSKSAFQMRSLDAAPDGVMQRPPISGIIAASTPIRRTHVGAHAICAGGLRPPDLNGIQRGSAGTPTRAGSPDDGPSMGLSLSKLGGQNPARAAAATKKTHRPRRDAEAAGAGPRAGRAPPRQR